MNTSVNATVNDAANGLSVEYLQQLLTEFTVEQIALGFTNALKLQGLEEARERQTSYNFVSTEYPEDNVSISMEAVRLASRAPKIRSSVMYALAVLPTILMDNNLLSGVEFLETYQQRRLYYGVLDKNTDHATLQLGNQTTNTSAVTTSERRALHPLQLTVQNVNATTMILTVPGANSPVLYLALHLVGLPIPQKGMFSMILKMMYGMGLTDAGDDVGAAEQSDNSDHIPVWIFVQKNPDTDFPFAVYHVLGILEGIARFCVQQGTYRELVYELFADGELVSAGCITQPVEQRKWCAGLRDLQGNGEGNASAWWPI